MQLIVLEIFFSFLWLFCHWQVSLVPHDGGQSGTDRDFADMSTVSSPSTCSPYQLFILYRGLIRPCMEYASQVWGGSTHTALLNRVESKAFRLINSPPLTDCLQSLKHRRSVASLSIFYRYFHGYCSSELANCMPPPLLRPRCTRLSTFSHPYSIHLISARVNQHLRSFIPFTGKLWNSAWFCFSTFLWL